jgi:YD repeat-containing protein
MKGTAMFLFRNENSRKQIAHILIISFFLEFFLPLLSPALSLKAGDGPAKPEAASFEPVDATDMVNLFTGDLSHNIPLLEVPGPEGAWPINMFYHAGIGPNSEASWVGLGWNLNPGAINRVLNGYPDDYFGGFINSHYTKQRERETGFGVSVGMGYGPVGMNIDFDSNQGLVGMNAAFKVTEATSISMGSSGLGVNSSLGPVGLNANVSGEGLSVGLSAYSTNLRADFSKNSSGKISGSIYGSISAGINPTQSPITSIGISISSNDGAAFTIGGFGFSKSNSAVLSLQTKSSGFSTPSIPIPLGPSGAWLSLKFSYYEREWWLDENHYERSFGLLHQSGYRGESLESWANYQSDNLFSEHSDYGQKDVLKDFQWGHSKYMATKFDHNIVNDTIFSAADFYQVNVQGLSGTFQPYLKKKYLIHEQTYEINDNENSWKVSAKLGDFEDYNKGKDIRFRFRGERGGQFYANNGELSDIEDGSKRIRPVIDVKTGRLNGFKITTKDGRNYEFFEPVSQIYNKNKNWYEGIERIESYSEIIVNSPYAYTWLLTGIKGPDYIDRGDAGFSAEDWGYWVKFNYAEKQIRSWRSPQFGYQKSASDAGNGDMYSFGIKENRHLESIETASHIAKFNTSDRNDNMNSQLENEASIMTEKWTMQSNKFRFELPIKKIDFLKLLDSDDAFFSADIVFNIDGFYMNTDLTRGEFAASGFRNKLFNNINLEDYLVNIADNEHVYFETDKVANETYVDYKNPIACKLIMTPIVKREYSGRNITNKGNDQFEITYPVSFSKLKAEGKKHSIVVRYSYKFGWGFGRRFGKSPHLEEGAYSIIEDKNDTTRILLNGKVIKHAINKSKVRDFEVRSAKLYIGSDGHSNFNSKAQKLDSVVVYKKIYNSEGIQIDLSESLETIKFDYDYTLLTNSPNSFSVSNDSIAKSGKLVLKSIKKSGLNGSDLIPATKFSYYGEHRNTGYVTVDRPLQWSEDSWDLWGGYSSVSDEKKHHNAQDRYLAARDAGLGSLSEIYTPLGGIIRIEYESDVISNVRGKYLPFQEENKITEAIDYEKSGLPYSELLFSDGFTNGYTYRQLKEKFDSGNLEGLLIAETQNIHVRDVSRETPDRDYIKRVPKFHSISKVDGSKVYLDNPAYFHDENSSREGDFLITTKYSYEIYDGSNYAGGQRVKSISVIDGATVRKTEYNYYGGSVYSIPTLYKNNMIEFLGESAFKGNAFGLKEKLYSSDYNSFAPAPNVGYANVEVKEINPNNGKALNGKTVFSYYNAKQIELNPDFEDLKRPLSYFSIKSHKAIDNTTLMGINYKVEHFGLKKKKSGFDKKDYFPVKTDYMIYETSSKMAELNNIKFFNKSFDEAIPNYKPGSTEQTYDSGERLYGTVKHTKTQTQENLFLIGTASKEYFYDENSDLSGIAETKVNNIGYDMLTGEMLITETKDSQNRSHVSESTPAYWKYPEMAEKNMLSQRAQEKGYLLDENETFYDLHNNRKRDRLVNASVNTWRPWTRAYENGKLVETPSNKVWRRDDSYVAVQTGPQFQEFNRWLVYVDDQDGDYQMKKYEQIAYWQRTSNITAYNRYSKAVEARSIDGNYSSSIYGHSDALPIATISGGKRENVIYKNFEDGESYDAHTGEKSKILAGYNELAKMPNENIKYTVTMWLKPDQGGSFTVYGSGSSQQINRHEWQLVILNGLTKNMPISVYGQGLVDDLRIYPDNASMTTYNYDPITWKISSITDANNRSIFYEYDDAGRLSRVLDEDKMLLNKTFYHFGKGTK